MVMKIIIAATVVYLAAVCSSFPIWPGFPYYHGSYNYNYWGAPHHSGYPYGGHYPYGAAPQARLVYYGQFKGSCNNAPDGLYFVDEYSFAYCSNGQKTIQPCAEGSANPPLDHFKSGGYYGLYDFCAVNLVAKRYTGYHAMGKKDNSIAYNAEIDAKSHYVEKEGYDVVERKGYHKENKVGYETPKKVEGYEETYHQQQVYEEPKKPVY